MTPATTPTTEAARRSAASDLQRDASSYNTRSQWLGNKIDITMSGTVNRLLAQDDLEVYEDAGAGTAHQISQDDEGLVNGENARAPSELAATVTVTDTGRHDPVAV